MCHVLTAVTAGAQIEAAAMEGLLAVRDAHSKLQIAQRQLQEAHERAEHECATARTARSEVSLHPGRLWVHSRSWRL